MNDRSEFARLSEYEHRPAPRKAPSPLSTEGEAAIIKELANMDWPGSSIAAARAGYYAAMRVMGIDVEPPPALFVDPDYPAGYPKP